MKILELLFPSIAESYDGMPPTSGFEVLANSVVPLVDDVTQLKEEIKYLKEERLSENNTLPSHCPHKRGCSHN